MTVIAATALAGCDLGAPPTGFDLAGGLAAVVDLDGDGHLDLVALTDESINTRAGDGAGGFAAATTQGRSPCGGEGTFTLCTPSPVTFADADGDGDVDMLEGYTTSFSPPPPGEANRRGAAFVRLNDGTGTFGAPTVTTSAPTADPTTEGPAPVFGDVTGDGLTDLVFVDDVSVTPRTAVVRPGDGTGAFGAGVAVGLPAGNVGAPVVEDVDGDGHADLVVPGGCVLSGPGDGMIVGCIDVLYGDGSGAFPRSGHVQVADVAVDRLTVEVVDIDGDGVRDLVGGRYGGNFDGGGRVSGLSTFLGDGHGAFGPEAVVPGPEQLDELEAADFDGDGLHDLLVSSQGEDLAFRGSILFGDGNGGFGDAHRMGSGREVVADVDEDGRPDLVGGRGAGRVAVYLNRWTTRP